MRSLVKAAAKHTKLSGATAIPWPPQLGLRTHPDSPITGSDSDVQDCTIAPGYVWQAVGTGAPVTRSPAGFSFSGGKYLQMTLPQPVTLRALSVHGSVTFAGMQTDHPDYDTARNTVQSVFGAQADGVATVSAHRQRRDLRTDLGPTDFNVRDLHTLGLMGDMRYKSRLVVGVHSTTLPEYAEYGAGRTAIWANGIIRIASDENNELTTDTFIMGKNFWGTVHEGVVFSEGAHSPLPLWSAGTNSQAVHKALTDRWGTMKPVQV